MANYGFIRMQKFQVSAVQGIQKHNQRQGKNSSNKDIDSSRSHLNYDLINSKNIQYEREIKNRIADRVERKPRANSVVLSEFIVTASPEYMNALSESEQKRYFAAGADFIEKKYGAENLVYAVVHKDEATPHMHVGITPITDDNRLSAKDIFNGKQAMIKLQDDFHHHMTELGFEIDRGESSERKNVPIHEFKRQTLEKEIEILEKDHETLQKDKNRLLIDVKGLKRAVVYTKDIKDMEDVKPSKIDRRHVRIPVEDFEQLKTKAKATEAFQHESLEHLSLAAEKDRQVLNLTDKNNVLQQENKDLKKENVKLKTENEKLTQEISSLQKIISYLQKVVEQIKENSFAEKIGVAVDRVQYLVGATRMIALRGVFGNGAMNEKNIETFPENERSGAKAYLKAFNDKKTELERNKRETKEDENEREYEQEDQRSPQEDDKKRDNTRGMER